MEWHNAGFLNSAQVQKRWHHGEFFAQCYMVTTTNETASGLSHETYEKFVWLTCILVMSILESHGFFHTPTGWWWMVAMNFNFPEIYWVSVIIPIDFHSYFSGWGGEKPPTSFQCQKFPLSFCATTWSWVSDQDSQWSTAPGRWPDPWHNNGLWAGRERSGPHSGAEEGNCGWMV